MNAKLTPTTLTVNGKRAAFEIENRSDMREDYFEADCIRLMPGHPLYEAAKAAA